MGIPAMVVTRKGFTDVSGNAYASLGFPAESPSVYEFPDEMFVAGSDLTPINENIDKIVYGLTKWEPKVKDTGVVAPPKITVEGKDYAEALTNMNLLFLRSMWGDGLPVLPATEERVSWILTGTDVPGDTVIGKIMPRGGIATAEAIATSLAMAGGRPEYLPVMIALVEALEDPLLITQEWQATTCAIYPMVVVNGPIAKEIRLNCGYNLLGPHPVYPANGAIGRALRFLLTTVGGAIPQVGTMSNFGGPRYINAVFAEDEAGLPPDWEPFSTEYWGYPRGSNVVTVTPVQTANNSSSGKTSTEEIAAAQIHRWAKLVHVPHSHMLNEAIGPGYISVTLLIPRRGSNELSSLGWSKEKIKAYLWENGRIPWSDFEKMAWQERGAPRLEKLGLPEGSPVSMVLRPENIAVIVAGGEQSGHHYFLHTGWGGSKAANAEIKLPPPAKWDALLKEAEDDLGPLPSE